jgi:hypothetical protein
VENDVKSKSELSPTSVGKVGEITPWIQEKKMEVVDLLYVVRNEMEATRLELDNVNKDKECVCTKMEHVKVVHELMTSMMEEKEKKLNVL